MRLISPREYAERTGQKFQSVYYRMSKKEIPVVEVTKTVKRIPWDDEKGTFVKPD